MTRQRNDSHSSVESFLQQGQVSKCPSVCGGLVQAIELSVLVADWHDTDSQITVTYVRVESFCRKGHVSKCPSSVYGGLVLAQASAYKRRKDKDIYLNK